MGGQTRRRWELWVTYLPFDIELVFLEETHDERRGEETEDNRED